MSSDQNQKTSNRGQLTLASIVSAGLRIVDESGSRALTMRRLAAELGVTPMALYRHVRDRDELLDFIVDEAIGQIEPCPPGADWQEALTYEFTAFWRKMTSHPGVGEILISRRIPGPNMALATERSFAAAHEAGFGDQAEYVVDTFFVYTLGAITFDLTRSRTARRQLQHPGMTLPYLRSHAASYGDRDPEVHFSFGLRAVLDGLEHQLSGPDSNRSD